MVWAIRASTPDDIPALVRADWAAFGGHPREDQVRAATGFVEVDRVFVAVDGDRVVGGGAALSLELTVPGPATVPAAGVTYIGVLPTHRRQGILTGVMARVVDQARSRGEPVAALLASESTIYRRFGFGVAVSSASVEIGRPYASLRRPVDLAGRLRMLDRDEMADVLPPVYDRYRRGQPGEVSRAPEWWARRLEDHVADRRGASGLFAVVWDDEAGGCPAGYVVYRVEVKWEGGLPGNILTIQDLVAVTPEARAGLWQYCFQVDLVGVLRAVNAPLDDPLRWMLVDPRRLRVTAVNDFLWIRLLDVEAALAARTYATDASLVIDVIDGGSGVGGRYRLDGGDGGPAACRRTGEAADVALEAADLASAYLGGVRVTTLAGAGLASELAPGGLARADALFAGGPAPVSSSFF